MFRCIRNFFCFQKLSTYNTMFFIICKVNFNDLQHEICEEIEYAHHHEFEDHDLPIRKLTVYTHYKMVFWRVASKNSWCPHCLEWTYCDDTCRVETHAKHELVCFWVGKPHPNPEPYKEGMLLCDTNFKS